MPTSVLVLCAILLFPLSLRLAFKAGQQSARVHEYAVGLGSSAGTSIFILLLLFQGASPFWRAVICVITLFWAIFIMLAFQDDRTKRRQH